MNITLKHIGDLVQALASARGVGSDAHNAGIDRAIDEIQDRFRHMHVAGTEVGTHKCAACGLYLFEDIHQRIQPEQHQDPTR